MNIQEIMSYLGIIRRWWWVPTLLFVATTGTMLSIALLSETQYQATVTVQVSAPPPQEVPLYSSFGRQALRDEIEQTRASFSEFLQEGDAPFQALNALPDIPMKSKELRGKITIDIPDNSQLLHIGVRALDPETAALLSNTLVEIGLERYGQLLAQPTANTRQFIERELEAAREELEAAEVELAQFHIDNRVGNLNRAIDAHHDLISSLRIQGDLARVGGDTARAQAIEDVILTREVELQNMIGLSTEYNVLVSRVERARDTHDFLVGKRAEAQIKENQILELNSIQIITPARAPRKPVSVIDSKLIVLGAVASVLASVLLVFLLEYLTMSGAFRGFRGRHEQSETVTMPDNVG